MHMKVNNLIVRTIKLFDAKQLLPNFILAGLKTLEIGEECHGVFDEVLINKVFAKSCKTGQLIVLKILEPMTSVSKASTLIC